jgi:predicted unusual protein kinase regulating ubiquinone biosynthesis (AarF/ABC1/UbiB family)
MALALRVSHLKRYKDIARLFLKYGRGDWLKESGIEEEIEGEQVQVVPSDKGEELARDLEQLGPTFIKLGQLLSTRSELLPDAYIEALSRLQDDIAPFPYAEVEQIVSEELNVRISKAFAFFEAEPIAAASLGQVHRAALRDGRAVVVKVQRPGIRQQIADDLEALEEIATLLEKRTKWGQQYQLSAMLEEFRKTLTLELDYRQEAQHLVKLGENLRTFERIVVPAPVGDYTSSRVLTMDFIQGKKITGLSPLALLEVDGEELADTLFHAYLKQIFVDGFFHADPHPGNVFITDDHRIALLDLGMVARVSPRMQEQLLQMVLAIAEGKSDETADFALKIGETTEQVDEPEFRRRVAELVEKHQDTNLGQVQVGRTFLDMARYSGDAGVRLPPQLTMLGKALLNLDAIGRVIAPEFDPNAAIRQHSGRIMNQRMLKSLSPGNIFGTVLEMKDLVDRLPARVNRILDHAANNQLALKVDTGIDASQFMVGLQRVANRLVVGLLLAALIVGATLMMRVETRFTIFGYPGLAMLMFLIAAGAGILLLVNIVLNDIRPGDSNKTVGR